MGQNLAEVIHVGQKLWEILRRSTAHLGRAGRILKRRGLYLLFLAVLLAGAYYLVTNDAVFRGGQQTPSLPVEGPAEPVAKPLPREPLSGAESVPEELHDKTGAHPAAATEEESAPAARQEEFTLLRPVEGETLTAFGFAWAPAFGDYRFHPGLDLEGEAGQEVRAAAAGTVSLVEYSEDWRYRVVVDAGNGYQVAYANLDSIKVAKGSRIEAGDVLGTLGHPGRQEAGKPVHLHLEVLKDGRAVDPAPYLQ